MALPFYFLFCKHNIVVLISKFLKMMATSSKYRNILTKPSRVVRKRNAEPHLFLTAGLIQYFNLS